jgi:hypothetical protein
MSVSSSIVAAPRAPSTLIPFKEGLRRAGGVHRTTLMAWIEKGRLPPPIKFGSAQQGRLFFVEQEFEEALAKLGSAAA